MGLEWWKMEQEAEKPLKKTNEAGIWYVLAN